MAFEVQEEIIFSEKQQRVLFYLEDPSQNHVTEIFYGGAAGGGKSFLICHWQIARRLEFAGTRGLIGRAVLKNLKATTYRTFIDVWREYYADNPQGVTYHYNQQDNILYFSNGSEILLKDLAYYPSDEDYVSLGSLELTDAAIDELPEIQKRAFEILQTRIRYKIDLVGAPKILATGNPSPNWVKERYIKTQNGKHAILQEHQKYIRATVHDNPNEEFKTMYIAQLSKLNEADKKRLLDGDWDVQLNEYPFFYSYSSKKFFRENREYQIDYKYPVELIFDFNKDPCVCILDQWHPIKMTYNIKRGIKANPATFGTDVPPLKALCLIIKRDYIDTGLIDPDKIEIGGDGTGTRGSALFAEIQGAYSLICDTLEVPISQVRIRRTAGKHGYNLGHKQSREQSNNFFSQIPEGHFIIWAEAHEVNNDLMNAKTTPDGKLEKDRKDNKNDYSDCVRYQIDKWHPYETYKDTLKKVVNKINKT